MICEGVDRRGDRICETKRSSIVETTIILYVLPLTADSDSDHHSARLQGIWSRYLGVTKLDPEGNQKLGFPTDRLRLIFQPI